jgi:predicted small lipoprotein YifL
MRWLLLALVILQSATCGQKGPLTLPDAAPESDGAERAAGTLGPALRDGPPR